MTEIETFASQTILFEPDAPSFEFDTRLGRRILDHVNSRSILYIVQRRLTMSRRVTCQGKLEMHEKVHYSIHELVLYALVRRVILFMGKTMLRAQDYRTNCNCKSKKKKIKERGPFTSYRMNSFGFSAHSLFCRILQVHVSSVKGPRHLGQRYPHVTKNMAVFGLRTTNANQLKSSALLLAKPPEACAS